MSRFKKTDDLFREVILQERPHRCEWCGINKPVFVAHILPKGAFPRLRYQRENVLLLCFYCHMERAHKNPLEFREWLTEYKGKDMWQYLKTMERMLPKLDLNLTYLCLKQELTK